MRSAGTGHPEWGYLAPAPRFPWTVRIFMVAAAIGATASGAVFCSLIYRPVAEASVAERTLVHAAEPTEGADRTTEASQVELRSKRYPLVEPRRASDPGAMPLPSDAGRPHARSDSFNRAGTGGTPQAEHASATASLAESPKITATETPTGRASGNERASSSAASEAAPAVWKPPTKKSRAFARPAPRYGLYATARYQPRYSARERGSYGLPSRYGLYGDRDYH